MFSPIARVNDFHLCPMQTPAVVPIPHVGGPVVGPGAVTVWAGGMPVSVFGDLAICVGPPDVMVTGAPTVFAEGRPVVRITDTTAHGGMVIVGLPTVMVGDSGGAGSSQAATMSAAKAGGSAFVRAECNAEAAKAAAAPAAPPPPTGTGWVEAEFVDRAGKPVPFQRVQVTDAAGVSRIGFSDKDGLVRVAGMAQGPCTITAPDLDESSFAPAETGGPAAATTAAAQAAAPPPAAAEPPPPVPTKARLVLQTLAGKPVANAPCTVTLGVAGTKLSTDGSGRLELEVPPGVSSGEVVLDGTGTTLHGVTIPFTISALPPESTILGQEARLNNLGYRAGTTADPTSPEFRSAVEEFQCDEGLTVDGKCGPVTQAKLRSVHGS
jgi:uncharacterized Zn-binding protein involved in type VI secretion